MSTCEKNLAKNFVKLKHISESKPRIRKLLLEKANKGTIQALFDLIYNIMIGKIPVSQENIKKLKKHKKFLRTIIKPELNFKQKKQQLIKNQRGGFIEFLPLILSAIPSIIDIGKGIYNSFVSDTEDSQQTPANKVESTDTSSSSPAEQPDPFS